MRYRVHVVLNEPRTAGFFGWGRENRHDVGPEHSNHPMNSATALAQVLTTERLRLRMWRVDDA